MEQNACRPSATWCIADATSESTYCVCACLDSGAGAHRCCCSFSHSAQLYRTTSPGAHTIMLGNCENDCEAISVTSYVSNATLKHDDENEDIHRQAWSGSLQKRQAKLTRVRCCTWDVLALKFTHYPCLDIIRQMGSINFRYRSRN